MGEEITDASGQVIGRRHSVLAHQPVQYSYGELHAAISAYLEAMADMLDGLSVIDVLRR